jgi:hypothetical protein
LVNPLGQTALALDWNHQERPSQAPSTQDTAVRPGRAASRSGYDRTATAT